MNLIFFQNIISPHQMPYISHLSEVDGVRKVVVIAAEATTHERKSMGWREEQKVMVDSLSVMVAPSQPEIESLLSECEGEDTWCMFSGINAFPKVASWLRLSLKFAVRRGIIIEAPYVYEYPLWMHAVRFALKDWKFVKYLEKVFLMGDTYVPYYRMWSNRWQVIPFMYCTEWKERAFILPYKNRKLRLLFVGSLDKRKNVQCLLRASNKLQIGFDDRLEIGIVGDGVERNCLELMASKQSVDVKFYGTMSMDKIPAVMEQYDVLVLPSLHDGWGAVVNEALTLGLYVVVSNKCGSQMILRESWRGAIFKSDNDEELASIISNLVEGDFFTEEMIKRRIEWSRQNISGRAVAEYFVKNLK